MMLCSSGRELRSAFIMSAAVYQHGMALEYSLVLNGEIRT